MAALIMNNKDLLYVIKPEEQNESTLHELLTAIIVRQSTRTFLSKEVVCPCLKRSFFVYLAENM